MSARLPSKPVENEETRDVQSRESINTNSIVMLAELPLGNDIDAYGRIGYINRWAEW